MEEEHLAYNTTLCPAEPRSGLQISRSGLQYHALAYNTTLGPTVPRSGLQYHDPTYNTTLWLSVLK